MKWTERFHTYLDYIFWPIDYALAVFKRAGVLKVLSRIPEGAAIIKFLKEKQIPLNPSPISGAAYRSVPALKNGKWYPAKQISIRFNAWASKPLLCGFLLHEARHAQQAFKSVLYPDRPVSPSELSWYHRAVEADAQADAIINLLKIKLSGNPAPFYTMRQTVFQPMFDCAEKQYENDAASLHDGRLKRMVFDAWFDVEDVKNSYADNMINSVWPKRFTSYKEFAAQGISYTPLTAKDIQQLGTAGGESVNYLTLPGFRPLDDPYYRDAFNNELREKMQDMTEEWQKWVQAPAPKALGK